MLHTRAHTSTKAQKSPYEPTFKSARFFIFIQIHVLLQGKSDNVNKHP